MIIIRALKYIFISVFVMISSVIILIRIPFLQRKIITTIFNAYSNRYFKLSFESSSIRDFATIDIYNVKVIINSNDKRSLNINKMSINLNIFDIILDSKIVIENLYFKDFEITFDNATQNKITDVNKDIKYTKILRLFTFVFNNIKLDNFVINYNNGENSLRNILNVELSNLEINTKNVKFNIYLLLRNNYVTIQDLAGNFSYYFISDSLSANNLRLLTDDLHFTGDIFLSSVSKLLKNKFLFYGFDGRLNIKKLLLSCKNLNKVLNIKNFSCADDYVLVNGRIIKNKDTVMLKNINFNYQNMTSAIDFSIGSIDKLLECKYNLKINNGRSLLCFINNVFGFSFKRFIDLFISDLTVNITGSNNKITGYTTVFDGNNKVNLKVTAITNISNLFSKESKNVNIVDKVNVSIDSRDFLSNYLKGLSIGEILVDFDYITMTEKSNFALTLSDIGFKMLKLGKIRYKGALVNKYIVAELEVLSKKFNIFAKNNLSLNNLSGLLEGNVLSNSSSRNKLRTDNVICNFKMNLLNIGEKYELRSLVNNIKLDINNVPIEISDVKALFSYENGKIDTRLTSEFIDVNINKADISGIINDLNIMKSRFLNLSNKELRIRSVNSYNTTANIIVKKRNIFNLFFYDIIDFGEICMDFHFSNIGGLIKNNVKLNIDRMFFIDNNISKFSVNIDNSLDVNGKIISSVDLKCKWDDDDIKFNSNIILLKNLIKSKITLDSKGGNIIDSNFNLDTSEGIYLDIDNKRNYIRLLKGKMFAEGTIKYDSKNVIFNNFSVYNRKRNINYLNINGRYNLDVNDRFADLHMSLDNININGINILRLKNLKCNVSSKATVIDGKINFDLFLNNLCIYDINYKNISIAVDTILINNNSNKIINLCLKQYDKSNEIADITGKLLFSDRFSFYFNIILDDFDLTGLRPFVYNILDIKKGFISTSYTLKGQLDNILVDGNGMIRDLALHIFSNGCYYDNISGDVFSFNSNEIGIYSIKAYQGGIECGNFNANVSLKKLFAPIFTLEGKLKNCKVFDKTSNNRYFYGLLKGTGDLRITINPHEIFVNGKIDVNNGNFHISSDEGSTSDIKIYTSEITALNKLYRGQVNKMKTKLDLDINFNKDTNIYLELNDFNNLYFTGNGNISIKFDDELKLNGSYNMSGGTYNIKLGDFLSKKFLIRNGKISFNNYLQYSNINIYAISDLYNINIDNKMSNVFLEVRLDGGIYSPNINYNVLLADNSAKKFNNDLKTFFSILFFNNFNSNQLTNSANTFINDLCSKVSGLISKDISIKVNSNLINILFNRQLKNLNFDVKYKLTDNISLEKAFDFSNYKNLYRNLSLNIDTELKNNMVQSIKLFKISPDEDTQLAGRNIASYNMHKSFNF